MKYKFVRTPFDDAEKVVSDLAVAGWEVLHVHIADGGAGPQGPFTLTDVHYGYLEGMQKAFEEYERTGKTPLVISPTDAKVEFIGPMVYIVMVKR